MQKTFIFNWKCFYLIIKIHIYVYYKNIMVNMRKKNFGRKISFIKHELLGTCVFLIDSIFSMKFFFLVETCY